MEATFPELDGNLCPTGPLITLEESYDRLRAGPCMKLINGIEQGPGTYTEDCIKSLFIEGGCSNKGLAFPMSKATSDAITLDITGAPKVTEDIVNTVSQIRTAADREYTFTTDVKRLEKANLACYGKFEFNPCKGPLEKSGPQSPMCLDFLFKNAGKVTTGVGPTYNQSSNRTSGSGVDKTKPILYCQRQGKAAPIGINGKINIDAVNKANTFGSIENIKNYYDTIHRTANYSLLSDDQYKAMLDCYGVTMSKGDSCNSDPKKRDDTTFSPLNDPTKIADGSKFYIVPAASPGSKFFCALGNLMVQANVPADAEYSTIFVSKEDADGYIQITQELKALMRGGKDVNARIGLAGFRVTMLPFNPIYDNDTRWKAVDSLAGTPGEVSFLLKSKPGFYMQFNKIRRGLEVNNNLDDKPSMSFSVKYV